MLKKIYSYALLIFLFTGITACSDDPVSDVLNGGAGSHLVVNEGDFSNANGSLTGYNPENRQVIQNQFRNVNNRDFAGIIQATYVFEDKLYIVGNSGNKIEVTDAETLESMATIPFDFSPAGFAIAGNKGYVSSLLENNVAVVDLGDYSVTETRIPAGASPRGLYVSDNFLYVANSGDSTLTVIDTNTDQVVSSIEVCAGPTRMTSDDDTGIWVVCRGIEAYDENWNPVPENDREGGIAVVDPSGSSVMAIIETGGSPLSMALNNQTSTAWIVNDSAVQEIDMNTYEVTNETFINRSFNGIGYSASEDLLYLAQSRGYSQNGQAVIYDINGAPIDSFATGIAPFDFIFKPN